ncbi:MAG TPA: FixH family protein, partial [Woeseiaceae bacterium]|nr:FixH family protein [Woeseiaceae bacterium]
MPRAKINEAWHRNPWVWLVIAIPALTVAGCLVTLYLALSNPDYLVRDPVSAAIAAGSDPDPA